MSFIIYVYGYSSQMNHLTAVFLRTKYFKQYTYLLLKIDIQMR